MYKIINGIKRSSGWPHLVEACSDAAIAKLTNSVAVEAYDIADTKKHMRADLRRFSSILKRTGNEQNKVFAYSKVCNALKVAEICNDLGHQPPFDCKPWLNVITNGDYVIAYIWDTRDIVASVKNRELAAELKNLDWEECVVDAYDGFDSKPMLNNPMKLDVGKAMDMAKGWVQPTLFISLPDDGITWRPNGRIKKIDWDINCPVKGEGWSYIGTYSANPDEDKFSISIGQINTKELWHFAPKAGDKFTHTTTKQPWSYLDIQYAFMDALTCDS